MPNYIRAYIPGGSYFFTVALLERRRCLLTEHIDALREAFIYPAQWATAPRRP
jgi:putative transposase